jgi:hypothetical protein
MSGEKEDSKRKFFQASRIQGNKSGLRLDAPREREAKREKAESPQSSYSESRAVADRNQSGDSLRVGVMQINQQLPNQAIMSFFDEQHPPRVVEEQSHEANIEEHPRELSPEKAAEFIQAQCDGYRKELGAM